MSQSLGFSLSDDETLDLVRRLELKPALIRRQLEEQIVRLVDLSPEFIEQALSDFCGDKEKNILLSDKGWTEDDLKMHVLRPESLRLFAAQRFGPGLEDRFLGFKGGRDQVIYSLLRVRDGGLARELWIRLEEGEITFAEAASSFSEGPEAQRKGVMGPLGDRFITAGGSPKFASYSAPGRNMFPQVYGRMACVA